MREYLSLLKKNLIPVEIPKSYECGEFPSCVIPPKLKPLWLRQFWSKNSLPREKAFAVLWREKQHLNILGFMEDSDVFSEAVGRNDKTWIKGDVLEFFFQPAGGKFYFEIHLSPNLASLELSIPDAKKLKAGYYPFEKLLYNSGIEGRTSQFDHAGTKGWWAAMRIPFDNLKIKNKSKGFAGMFSVCRYNYNHKWGRNPEHSSSSALPNLNFHDPDNWHELEFI